MFDFLKKMFNSAPEVDYRQLTQQGALILDVRSPEEYKGGHIPGSTNIPLDQLAGKIQSIVRQKKPVITVCRSGARSGMAVDILRRAGVEAYNGGPWGSLQRKL
ncbi:MAG: rhodanese-like domain-containing protein [Saprospiraceae bacterium]